MITSGGWRRKATIAAAVLVLGMMAAPAHAIHEYRGPGGGCTPADGPTTDDAAASGPVAATISVLHNTFNDKATGLPQTHVKVGDSVVWEWASAHCHSVQAAGFYSGFHYPTAEPESPHVLPGLFDYPVPDDTPTLSYRHTFTTVGSYSYACEHHASIGMIGTIVVDPA
jgi:plastocyanin